jgi:phosphate transport system protein
VIQVDRHHHRIHPVAWLAGDDDRNAGTVHHGSADRTEQHSGESATAVATDDDQLGRLGLVEKTAGRLIPNHHPFDADVGLAFLPAGDALRQWLLGGGLLSRPFQARNVGHLRVARGVQGHQVHTPPGSLVERDRRGQLRCRDTCVCVHTGRAERMRTVYHEKLSELSEQLGRMCGLAGAAMERATRALMQADLTSAEQVITDQDQIMAMTTKAEQNGIALLALQQPVAGELRTIVSSIQAVADVERMGALAVHVAKIARRRHPQHVLPEEVNGCFAEMGRVAVELGNSAQEVLRMRDPEKAAGIREQDDAMDDLHRQLFTVLMDREWKHGVPAAVDVALLGRFYERFADHAVEVGRRVVFQATGTLPPEQEVGTY